MRPDAKEAMFCGDTTLNIHTRGLFAQLRDEPFLRDVEPRSLPSSRSIV